MFVELKKLEESRELVGTTELVVCTVDEVDDELSDETIDDTEERVDRLVDVSEDDDSPQVPDPGWHPVPQ